MEYEERIQKFIDRGFDTFIGRRIGTNGVKKYQCYTHMTLRSLGSICMDISPYHLRTCVIELLCKDVQEGKRILLTKSPGYIPPREGQCNNFVDLLRREFTGDDSIQIKKEWVVSHPETFLVFQKGELEWLEREYEKRLYLKIYPNPFLYQPE